MASCRNEGEEQHQQQGEGEEEGAELSPDNNGERRNPRPGRLSA